MKRRIIPLLLVLLMAVSIAACGGKTETPAATSTATATPETNDTSAPADTSTSTPAVQTTANTPTPPEKDDTPPPPVEAKDTINIAITADDGTLAMEYLTTGIYGAMAAVQEPLWDVLEDGTRIDILAESVEEPSDTEMIIHLRDVKFSNGNPLDAEDVLFSVGLYKAAGMTGGPRTQTIEPERSYAIDEHTVSLGVLPNIARWQILSQFFIYDKESYTDANALNPIGTGPYKVVSYITNSSLKLERRDDYWGEPGGFKYINFQLLTENSQRANAIETGEVDAALIDINDVDHIKSLSNIYMDSRYTQSFTQLNFNLGHNSEFYQNVEARRAIVHSINAEAILQVMFLGQGELVKGPTNNTICFDWEDRFVGIDETYREGYNIELAKQYAESSGLVGKTLQLLTSGDTKLAEMVQSMVQELGVTVEIMSLDPAQAYLKGYDNDSDHDFSVGTGIAPNRIVGDQLLNGVRYFPQMTAEGGFEGNMEYLAIAPTVMSELDPQKHSDITYDLLTRYENNVLAFGICSQLVSNAYSNAIDANSIRYSIGTGMVRVQDLKPAA